MQILILGMHRSGTSVVARLLNMMGAYFAPEGVSNGANEENPKGFWERQDVRALNDLVLHSAGADWHRLSSFSLDRIPEATLAEFKKNAAEIILAMDAYRPWFLKEPRFCLLAPLWLELLEFPLCLIVYRSPLEVARSLEIRNHLSPRFGLALWERYNTAALETTRSRRRIQINHADLMAEPVAAVRSLEKSLQLLGVRGLRPPSDDEIRAFIDPALYRAKEEEVVVPEGLSASQRALSKAFRSGKALLAKKGPRFSAAAQTVLVWEDALARHRKEITRLKDRNVALSTEVSKLKVRLEQGDRTAAESREKLVQLTDQLRLVTAARDEAGRNALTAELRKTLQHEMKLLQQAATVDATNAELQARQAEITRLSHELEARAAELAESRVQVSNGIAKIHARDRELKREKSRLTASIKRLEPALAERRARVDELTAENQILKQGLKKIEGCFERLHNSHSFQFMVYTARRLGLVSRTPRRCVEEIKDRFLEMHRALKPREIGAGEESPREIPRLRRELKSAPFVGLRAFDNQSIERITHQLTTPVSIVIPIYNNPDELRRCLESVLLHTHTPFELILVDDCSPDPAIGSILETYATHGAIRVIRSPVNQGFVRSANLGLQATQRDVVLLNSDTEVTPRWLQKLTIAAYSDLKIATVTPFSNAAGAFSVPQIGVNAPIPFPFTVLKIARLTERVSSRVYPGVPTGNGFCMYIKREALNQVGGFDEENFGRGYGEENDFCMRATKAGWRHIIDDSLLVYHRGNSSFGEEKQALLKENRQTLDRLHPTYTGLVREFTNSPEINAIRASIGERLARDAFDLQLEKPRMLFILQEGGGGVPMTNTDLVSKISATHECYLLSSTGSQMILRAWENGQLVDKKRWSLPGVWSAKDHSNPAAQRIYFEVLTGLGIDLVHIRHLFKHSFDAPFICKQLGIPVVLSFHDYYFVCPSVHLLDQNAKYCGGECTPGLQQCTIPSPMLQDLPMLKEYLPDWRRKVADVLDCCDAFVTTAESVREVHQRAYPQLMLKPFWVIEHGRDFTPVRTVATPPRPGETVRILVAGNIDPHKGSVLIRQLKDLDQEGLLEFHFLGQTDAKLRDIGVHHGAYQRDDFPKLARTIRPSFAAVLSIWAETYSHTVTEAWSVGLPVLGSNLGAVGERIAKHGGGWVVDITGPAAVLTQIRQIVADPVDYQKKVEAASRVPLQRIDDMADGYRALYGRLLAGPALKQKLRVGCIEPRGDRGSTFVRLRLPFAEEEMRQDVLATRLPPGLSKDDMEEWVRRLELDVIIVQRDVLAREASTALVELCQSAGIRLVLEIDDNLLGVDESHAEFARYKSRAENVKFLAGKADDVVVSTDSLATPFLRLNERTTVVRNALDEWLWFGPVAGPIRSRSDKKIVAGYMGTPTHGGDLNLIREPYLRAREHLRREHGLDLVLQMIGGLFEDDSPPWYERIEIPEGWTGYPEFVRWLRETVDWDFGFAPLADNPLNQSKSALKFLEYAALGVPAVFSSVGEYPVLVKHRENGLLVSSNSPAEWEAAIVELASSSTLRNTLTVNARRETRERHLLGQTVPIWKTLLNVTDRMGMPVSVARPDRAPPSSNVEILLSERAPLGDLAPNNGLHLSEPADPTSPAGAGFQNGERFAAVDERQAQDELTTVLFVLHMGGGGTILTSADLAANLPSRFRSLLLKTGLTSWNLFEFMNGKMVPLRRYHFEKQWTLTEGLDAERRKVLSSLAEQYGVNLVHFRHLLANGPEAISLFQQTGARIVFSFHDFYAICPTVQLIDGEGHYCGGPCTKGESDCALPTGWIEPDFGRLRDAYVHTHRAQMASAVAECDWFVTTSEASRAVILENMPEIPAERFSIVEHGRDLPLTDVASAPEPGAAARVVCFGALNATKGLVMLSELLKLNAAAGHPFEFHFLGNMIGSFRPEKFGGIKHGPYRRQELATKLVSIRPSFSVVASIWPETYCHALTESWTSGIPVLASNIGTLRERVLRHGGGWLLDPHDAAQWLTEMQRILSLPSEYAARKAEVLAYRPRSIDQMVADYCEIYHRILQPAQLTSAQSHTVG